MKKRLFLEIIRQIAHILIGLAIILLILLSDRELTIIILFILFCLSVLFSLSIIFFKRIAKFKPINFLLENLGRDYDRKIFPAKGLVFFFAGCLLTIKLFDNNIALAAITILAFGDSVSTLVGLFGKTRYNNGLMSRYKTLYGTLLGILVSFLVALLFVEPVYALIASLFGMISEAISIKLGESEADDNLIVPIIAGGAVYIAKIIGI